MAKYMINRMLQYLEIYSKLKRRKNYIPHSKLQYRTFDNKNNSHYLCGDNNMLNRPLFKLFKPLIKPKRKGR